MYKHTMRSAHKATRQTAIWMQLAVLALALTLPIFLQDKILAAQVTSRKVTISSSQAGKTGVRYLFNFSQVASADAPIQGIILEFCTSPLGVCTKPTGMDVNYTTASVYTGGAAGAQTFTNATTFNEVVASTGDCNVAGNAADTKYCVSRTQAANETAGAKQIAVDAITNPTLTSAFTSVYVRMSFYNNNTFSAGGAGSPNIVQYGTVAAAITQQLTTQGRVQERLEFCVAAVEDGGPTDTTLPANCAAAPNTTTVDLGVVDSATIVKSPADGTATNPANDFYGIAMVNTNAAGGVVIQYYPEQETVVANSDTDQLYSFRVANTDCSATATAVTDQCFVSASNAGEQFTAGSEKFGLYVPCIDNFTVSPTRSTTSSLTITTAYLGDTSASAADCENVANDNFAWNASATGATIASSTTVVDDEIVKISFGATASNTTPTGLYRVTTTYIATPTF